MKSFHVNPKTGNPGRCRATRGGCPFGTDAPHFPTPEEARQAFEGTMEGHALQAFRRSRLRRRVVTAGLVAMSFALTACGQQYNQPILEDPSSSQVVQEQQQDPFSPEAVGKRLGDEARRGIEAVKKQVGQEEVDAAKEGAKKGADAVKRWGKKEAEDLSRVNGGTVTSAEGEVYFQGKSLTPKKGEVEEARRLLKTFTPTPETPAENGDPHDYNRAEQYGKDFNPGVVGRLEHRDIPNGSFRGGASSRAVGGTFVDPYTGKAVTVVRGSKTDTNVDHIIPLKEAHESGAWTDHPGGEWANDHDGGQRYRNAIANDPLNLQVVGSKVNQSKSDNDAADFVPSYEPAQCIYAVRQIEVKAKYNLTMDQREVNALDHILATRCSKFS